MPNLLQPAMTLMLLLIGAALPAGKIAQDKSAESSSPTVAVLIHRSGAVTLTRKDNPSASKNPLKVEVGTPLVAGDLLKCEPTGSLVLLTARGEEQTVDAKACAATPYKIELPKTDSRYAAALKRFGSTGGRPRGMAGLLIWPRENVRARVETAARIEWRPQTQGTLTLTLRGEAGDVLWTQTVDAISGTFQQPELAAALRRYSEGSTRRVTLQLRLTAAQSTAVSFPLLGTDEEQRLQEKLADLPKLTGPAAALLRADVFLQEGLQREALEEYLAALQVAPDAPFLLQKAAELASELADRRASDLTKRSAAVQ